MISGYEIYIKKIIPATGVISLTLSMRGRIFNFAISVRITFLPSNFSRMMNKALHLWEELIICINFYRAINNLGVATDINFAFRTKLFFKIS